MRSASTSTRRCSTGADRRRVARLPEAARARVKLLNDDVRQVVTEPVDIVGAFNFSYFCFKAREEMRDYFKRVHAALRPRRSVLPRRIRRSRGVGSAEGEDQARRLHVRMGPSRVRARHEPHRLPHPLQVPRRLEDQARVHLRLAALDVARAARAARSRPDSRRSASIGKETTATAVATASSTSTRRERRISRGSLTSSPKSERLSVDALKERVASSLRCAAAVTRRADVDGV